MPRGSDPSKAKTARRVVEVLEYFDDQTRQATVMDIARRYNRPQSSTSELLATLVDLGLLYKDPRTRAFMPTPRAAMLGGQFQPAPVRDGRLAMQVERLRAETGLGVAVLGMVGRTAQVFRWLGPDAGGLGGGAETPLHDSAAGWLLLSTLAPERRAGLLRRLRADAPEHARFRASMMSEQVAECGRQGWAVGPAGFGGAARMCAVLLPGEAGDQPLVLALVAAAGEAVDAVALITQLRRAALDCAGMRPEHVVQLDDYRSRLDLQPLIPAKAESQAAIAAPTVGQARAPTFVGVSGKGGRGLP